jgi:2-keto-4-pentenoate hydratase/2-oxohepta-3-ene-1,7-dioic acid hydratase in catechol pathway
MKLASYAADGKDRIGAEVEPGQLIDLSEALAAMNSPEAAVFPVDMISLIEAGPSALASAARALEFARANPRAVRRFAADSLIWHPPVRRPSKLCCVAMNNSAMDERKIKCPAHPAYFEKTQTALVGHGQPIRMRPAYGRTHPEPELAVVIARRTRDVTPAQALQSVFGYTIHNDITSPDMRTEDSYHYRSITPSKTAPGETELIDTHTSYSGRYKGSDTFSPLGPFIVTPDEVGNPHDLEVSCTVAGETITSDNTSGYNHKVAEVISFISHFQTLLPGDVVSLGTATRKGSGRPLQHGDLNKLGGPVTVKIAKLGTLSNPVVYEDNDGRPRN